MNNNKTLSSWFDRNRRNSEVIEGLVAERNGGNRSSRSRLLDILGMVRDESLTGVSSEVAVTLLENDSKFRRGVLFLSRKQAWAVAAGATELGLNLGAAVSADTVPADSSTTGSAVQAAAKEREVPAVQSPVIPSWTPHPDGVRLGDTVDFVDTQTGCLMSFRIVGKESNSLSDTGVMYIDTPVAKAFLGHVADDMVDVMTPAAVVRTFQLLSVKRPWQVRAAI